MLTTNLKFGEVYSLESQVALDASRVSFSNIFGTGNGGVALVGFKAGQKLDEHLAPAELMVYALEGEIEFTVADTPHTLRKGDFILVGEAVRHKVLAKTDAKMMLVKVKN